MDPVDRLPMMGSVASLEIGSQLGAHRPTNLNRISLLFLTIGIMKERVGADRQARLRMYSSCSYLLSTSLKIKRKRKFMHNF